MSSEFLQFLSEHKKNKREKPKQTLVFLTCYDYQTAIWLDKSDIDAVLVGDSLGELVYGFPNTTTVTMEMMLRHTEAVRKGIKTKHLIADMPIHSYPDPITAVKNTKLFISAGADSIKMENPSSEVLTAVCENHDVLGHVGLTPQTNQDYKKQGKDDTSAEKIYQDALRLDKLGCYGIVLEAIPDTLAERVTQEVAAVTIGIASGNRCDGQIRVYHDIVGLTFPPKKFAPPYRQLGEEMVAAVNAYTQDIKNSISRKI